MHLMQVFLIFIACNKFDISNSVLFGLFFLLGLFLLGIGCLGLGLFYCWIGLFVHSIA